MLTLPIKRKWFDLISSGKKLEEYRAIKDYYKSRFKNYNSEDIFQIRFRAGYSKTSPLMQCEVLLKIGEGK